MGISKRCLWWCDFKISSSELVSLLVEHYPPKKPPSKESPIFTPYVRKLDIWSGKFLAFFADALCTRMRWRGLSKAPPEWINYPFGDWKESGAFDALLVDGIDYAVVKRISSLLSALKKYDNVDPDVYKNIQSFLGERQRKHDPIGYAVGKNAQDAVQQAVEQRVFTAQELDNKGKVCNQTILTFSAIGSPDVCDKDALKSALGKLKKWHEVRLKLGEMRKAAQADLCKVVCQLAEKGGITRFKFGDLAKIMKDEVRSASPEHPVVEDDDGFNQFAQRLDKTFKTLKYDTTDKLWQIREGFLKQIHDDIDKLNCGDQVHERIHDEFQEIVEFIEADEELPSQAQLAKRLKIPKNTLNRDMKLLRQLFDNKWTMVDNLGKHSLI